MARFIQSFGKIPKELFRLNNGGSVALRDRTLKATGMYDLLTEAGKVKPKALNPTTYEPPNGASMRPNTKKQNDLVKGLKGKDVVVYSVAKGTSIPTDLILVHEFGDHYSLQAREEMTLNELNDKINDFLKTSGQCYTKEEWLAKYPKPTETS